MAKKLPPQSVLCTTCHARFEAAPRHTFLGLYRFTCPHCSSKVVYPMSARRRKWYIGIAIFFAAMCGLVIVAARAIPIPGILPVGVVVGLIQDSNARSKVREAEAAVPAFQP
jgi:hypothetical protein